MRGYTFGRLLTTIVAALIVAGALYFTHPGWFTSKSEFSLPSVSQSTATPGATVAPIPTKPKPVPTATVPRISMTLHLDDIWITPFKVEHLQGAPGMMPNLGDELLVVHLRIQNRSQIDYPVRLSTFEVLDTHGEIVPPLPDNFTRQRLREVRLIPHGFTHGVLVFEVPSRDPAATLIYQPDPLDPTKRKEWLLQ